MKTYLQFIKENASYLTEPLDPEFSTEIVGISHDDFNRIFREYKEKIEEYFESIANQLGLELDINEYDTDRPLRYNFKKGNKTITFKLIIDSLFNSKILNISMVYSSPTRTVSFSDKSVGYIKEFLIDMFDINENQQYLTEPYDPEFEPHIQLLHKDNPDNFLNKLYEQMNHLADKMNIKLDIIEPKDYIDPEIIKVFRFTYNKEVCDILLCRHILKHMGNRVSYKTRSTVRVSDMRYSTFSCMKHIEGYLDIMLFKNYENQQYLTEPFDPDFDLGYIGPIKGIEEYKKKLISMLELFCNNKNLKFKIENKDKSLEFTISEHNISAKIKFVESHFTENLYSINNITEGTLLMDTEDEDGMIVIESFEQLEEEINNFLDL